MTQTEFVRRLQPEFPRLVRELGTTLWHAGAVDLRDVTESDADAGVRSHGIRYQVRIVDFDEPGVTSYRCSCRPVSPHTCCAHAFATLLALAQLLAELDEATVGIQRASQAPAQRSVRPRVPKWQQRLASVVAGHGEAPAPLPLLEYYVELRRHDVDGYLRVAMRERTRKKNGELGVPRAGRLLASTIERLGRADRTLVELAQRAPRRRYHGGYGSWGSADLSMAMPWEIALLDLPAVLPQLAATGRVLLGPVPGAGETRPALRIDVDDAYEFVLQDAPREGRASGLQVQARFVRGDESIDAGGTALRDTDYALVDDRLIRIECHGAHQLATELVMRGSLQVNSGELPRLLTVLAQVRGAGRFLAPMLDRLPPAAPVGVLQLTFPASPAEPLQASLRFDYDGVLVDAHSEHPLVSVGDAVRRRDAAVERSLRDTVVAAGVMAAADGALCCPRQSLGLVVQALGKAGLRVLAEGKRLRPFVQGSGSVSSGIDWLEVRGSVQFDGGAAGLPELLRRKITPEGFVELGDGSIGLLPAAWLRQVEALRLLGGDAEGDVVKLANSQALLLDALLASREQTVFAVDAHFAALRRRLEAFTRVAPATEAPEFCGQLRPYQREGLGWLQFLREFQLGGCLADDMGLGKTVMVLALLVGARAPERDNTAADGRRRRGKTAAVRPSLLVAPRSVLGNWLAEVQRFAPSLRVVDFSSAQRWRDGTAERVADCDLVLTTYALVRADAATFDERGLRFHYAILDEAQAIKNPDSLSSKAVRLLRAMHRLVLTGTPVENHLGDLWSLFEFLNPGMLGRLPAFRGLFSRDAGAEAMAEHRELVQRALRPVLLRRTKAQVLTDLPAKIEQTLWCELAAPQRRRYEQLKAHYRERLLAEPGELGDPQRFTVLEALLRLRQACCHEGLLDPRSGDAESAKFEELLPRLEELAAEGHKALVFSQFTSLLDLLEFQLGRRGMTWERLDGRTRNRSERVERFQTDAKCPLFLVSLKAGGYGLNLTAASYVFLLDPWWNPAVEMQAIDRSHRIGQRRTVNAYRLVCRGTVEERVLELQQQKKSLCEAILGNERSLLQDLTRADLELLLG